MENKLLHISFQSTKDKVDEKLIDLFTEISGICGSISVFMILEFWAIDYDIKNFLTMSNDGVKGNNNTNGSNAISLSYAILKNFSEFVDLEIYWKEILDLEEFDQKQKDEIIRLGGKFNNAISIEQIVDLMSNDCIPIVGFKSHFSPLKGYQKSNNKLYFPNYQTEIGDSDMFLDDFNSDKSWNEDKTGIFIKRKTKF